MIPSGLWFERNSEAATRRLAGWPGEDACDDLQRQYDDVLEGAFGAALRGICPRLVPRARKCRLVASVSATCVLALSANACDFGTAVSPTSVDLERLTESYTAAVAWFLANLRDDGRFTYALDASTGEVLAGDNDLRQLMSARLLADLANEDRRLLALHDRNLDYVTREFYRDTALGLGYILYDGRSKLGSIAMALRTFVVSPRFPQHERRAAALAATIMHLMDDRGAFAPLYVGDIGVFEGERLLTFYSGEAILALLEYAFRSGSDDALDAAIRAQRYYVERYVKEISLYYYPAYVPWHTMSLYGLFKLTGYRGYADAALVLNDKLLELQDTIQYVGRFFNPDFPEYGAPHSASDGVYTEGMTYAYELAVLVGDVERVVRFGRAMALALENLYGLQVADVESTMKDSSVVVGAFRTRVDSWILRIDNTQHVIDAYRRVLEMCVDEPRLDKAPRVEERCFLPAL